MMRAALMLAIGVAVAGCRGRDRAEPAEQTELNPPPVRGR